MIESEVDSIKLTMIVISSIVSLIVMFLGSIVKSKLDSRFHIFKLQKEHEYEQKKKIKEAISKNKIKIIDAAESLNHRMWNFYENHDKMWHVYNPKKTFANQYYLSSFIYRILVFYSWCHSIEKEIVYIDSTLANEDDLYFVKFLKSLSQIMCDMKLFDGFDDYDRDRNKDHFYKNDFVSVVEQIKNENSVLSFDEFNKKVNDNKASFKKIRDFLSKMSPDEERLRWHRLRAMHYLLIMFINNYGYDFQYTDKIKIQELEKIPIENDILVNMHRLLGGYKLDKNKEVKIVFDVLKIPPTTNWSIKLFSRSPVTKPTQEPRA